MKKIHFILLISCLIFASCKKEEPTPTTETETPDPTPAPVTASSSPQFSGKIDGVDFNYTNAYYDSYLSETYVSSGEPSTFAYGFTIVNANSGANLSIKKGRLTLPNGGFPSNSEFASFFTVGESGYDPFLQNGVEVFMYDNLGVEWSTGNGSADQTGSTFKILESVIDESDIDYLVKAKLSVSCKLYDESGNVKTLTDGIIVGSFRKD